MRTDVKYLVLLGGLVALGCNEPTALPPQTLDFDALSFSVHPEGSLRQGVFTVCKVGSSADFEVEIVIGSSEPITKTVHVNEDECVDVYTHSITTDQRDVDVPHVVTITEIVPNGFVLDRVEIFNIDPDGNITSHEEAGPTISGSVSTEKLGCLAVFYNVPEGGGEGCTPGFWKTRPHQDDWPPTGLSQNDVYDAVFGVNNLIGPSLTLLGGVSLKGNSYNSFIRHSVAALLNASHPDVAYDLSPSEVIAIVQAAHASGDFATAKNQLQALNEQGCSLG